MAYNESVLTVLAFVSGGVSGLTGLLAVTRSRGGTRVAGDALAGVAVAAALWAATFGLRISAGDPATAAFWLRVGTVVSAPIPTLLIVFALYQTGNAGVTDERLLALLTVEPTAAASLAVTNPLHGQYVASATTVAVGGNPTVGAVPGIFMLGHLSYSLLLSGLTTVLFADEVMQTTGPYRRQAALILTAVSIPMVTVVAYVAELPVAPTYDTTPLWFGVSTVLLLVAIQEYGLFDVSPVAHETIFEEIDDAIVIADDRGRIVDTNPAARRAFHLSEETVGAQVTDVLPGSDQIRTLLAEGQETLTTGDDRHFEATRTRLSAGQPGVTNVLVFRDVTDRERVQRRFQTYVEQSNDVLVVLDEDADVEYASAAAERVFGVHPDVLAGKSLLSLAHPDDSGKIQRLFAAAAGREGIGRGDGGQVVETAEETATDDEQTGRVDETEQSPHKEPDETERERFRIQHSDGGWRTVEAIVAAGVGSRGERLLVNIRDVTDQQRYEQRLRVLNRVLRHDLRNDANVVLGYADLLLKADLDPSVQERAEAVRRKANRLVELGEQAREVDRTLHAEGGDPHEIDLHDVVGSVAWRARETYPDAQIDADCPGEVVALGNDLLESAFWHLVSNGIDHNDSEVPWVRISVDVGDEWVRVTVTDDGPGIPESERKVLAHGTETALEHGSGLGLWLVKWITDSVGGDVSFSERDPRGSKVTIRIATPVQDDEDDTGESAESDATDDETATDERAADPTDSRATGPTDDLTGTEPADGRTDER
jgi:PAS domain S-box-containing protein